MESQKSKVKSQKSKVKSQIFNYLPISVLTSFIFVFPVQAKVRVKDPFTIPRSYVISTEKDAEGFQEVIVPDPEHFGLYFGANDYSSQPITTPEIVRIDAGSKLKMQDGAEIHVGNHSTGNGRLELDGKGTELNLYNGRINIGGSGSKGEFRVTNGAVFNQILDPGYYPTDWNYIGDGWAKIYIDGEGSQINFTNYNAREVDEVVVDNGAKLTSRHNLSISSLKTSGDKTTINSNLYINTFTNSGNVKLTGNVTTDSLKNTGNLDIQGKLTVSRSLVIGDNNTAGVLTTSKKITAYSGTWIHLKNVKSSTDGEIANFNFDSCNRCTIVSDSSEKLIVSVDSNANNVISVLRVNKGYMDFSFEKVNPNRGSSSIYNVAIAENATLDLSRMGDTAQGSVDLQTMEQSAPFKIIRGWFDHSGVLNLADGSDNPKFQLFDLDENSEYLTGGKLIVDTRKDATDMLRIRGKLTYRRPTEIDVKNSDLSFLEYVKDNMQLAVIAPEHDTQAFVGRTFTSKNDVVILRKKGSNYYWWLPQIFPVAYEQMAATNQDLLFTTLGTWRERRGENLDSSTWGRVINKSLETESGLGVASKQHQYVVQVGQDFARLNNANSQAQFGGFVTFAQNNVDFQPPYDAEIATAGVDSPNQTGKTRLGSLGLYYSQQYNNGLYTDFVASAAYLHNKYQPKFRVHSSNSGTAILFSGEMGYQAKLSENLRFEPQVQLAYQRLSLHQFEEQGRKHIHQGTHHGIRGRLGSKLTYQLSSDTSVALVANLWENLNTGYQVSVSNKHYLDKHSKRWYELGMQGDMKLTRCISLYGNLSLEHSLNGLKRKALQGQFGMKFSW